MSIFRRFMGGDKEPDLPKETAPNSKSEEKKFEINPYALGGAGFISGSEESKLWNFILGKYKQDGVRGLSYEEIIGTASDETEYLKSKKVVDELVTPTDPARRPLLEVREDGKLYPTKAFGILKNP